MGVGLLRGFLIPKSTDYPLPPDARLQLPKLAGLPFIVRPRNLQIFAQFTLAARCQLRLPFLVCVSHDG